MRVLVSTDTSCLIDYKVLKKYEISVFPLNVIIDGEEFLDGVTINQDQLRDAMRSGKNVKTSTPPLGEIYDYFEKLFNQGYDHIIHFTISSKLSSMYDLFCNVAEQNFKGKLTIIDSYALSSLMLSHVLYAYDEVQKGTAIEDIVKNVKERNLDECFVFIPENLTALKNGGRISPTVALIGNSIGIKPVIVLRDGALEKAEIIRNAKRTMVDKLQLYLKKFSVDEYDYNIVSFDVNPSVLNYVYETAGQLFGDYKFIKSIIPINACAHCGPGTIGFVVSPKINGKSLNDFIG